MFTVKNNTKRLYSACKRLPWKHIPAHSSLQRGRGRQARRTIKVTTVPAWITFPGAAQIAQIRRTVTTRTGTTVEVVYVITSADHHAAPPAVLAGWVQTHWAVENRLHYVRDVTYTEDASRVRTGHAPRVMGPYDPRRSACCAWPAGPTSPKPHAITTDDQPRSSAY